MKKIALAGNPNVGKSTIFNALTGMHQHTGNWPGKTVTQAIGNFKYQNDEYELIDLPGTYSLISHSDEEKVARNFLCFEEYDCVLVVCDAVCLEKNLNLVLQVLEITSNVIVCVNLLDEARKNNLIIDLKLLEKKLGVPVIGMEARRKKGINELLDTISKADFLSNKVVKVRYSKKIEEDVLKMEEILKQKNIKNLSSRWLALRLLECDCVMNQEISEYLGYSIDDDKELKQIINANNKLEKDKIVEYIVKKASDITSDVTSDNSEKNKNNRLDKILTSKVTGIPIMLIMLMIIFWLTITASNYPSQFLFDLFSKLEDGLLNFCYSIKMPDVFINLLVGGIYRTLSWVVSVMLPPMAIFFPLFYLLEDFGILTRIAFNLDKGFQKCCACGKQALCMMMGFGCNACGVTGARIIDSPRERLIAILTNSFVPCNGRFPTMISIITMFFIGKSTGAFSSIVGVIIMLSTVMLGIFMTFVSSKILSKTVLKGQPSSFTLELPPYRAPKIGNTIVRSIFDRTLYVLGRAVVVALPAGIVLWLLANINVSDVSLLRYITDFFDPFARLMGLDGVILTAFILGFPANEIVIPIAIMAYTASGELVPMDNLVELKDILIANGWTWNTAICTIIFSLMHWPCSTTCLTMLKETKSWKWTLIGIALPTICGILACMLITAISGLIV